MESDITTAAMLCGGGVFLVSTVVALVIYVVFARVRVPIPRVDYLREAPDDLPPALVGAVWRGGPVGEPEMAGTLMDLTDRGVVRMERVAMRVTSTVGAAQDRQVTQWTLDRSRAGGLAPIDAGLVTLLFDRIARDDTLTLDELRWQAHGRKTEYRRALQTWVATVDAEARRAGLLRDRPPVVAPLALAWASVSTLGVAAVSFAAENPLPLAPVLIANALLIMAARGVTRRTLAGTLARERYRALRDFLRDFSDLERVEPEQLPLWRHYLVLAVVLGVSERLGERFSVARPGLRDDPRITTLAEWLRPGSSAPSPAEELRSIARR